MISVSSFVHTHEAHQRVWMWIKNVIAVRLLGPGRISILCSPWALVRILRMAHLTCIGPQRYSQRGFVVMIMAQPRASTVFHKLTDRGSFQCNAVPAG